MLRYADLTERQKAMLVDKTYTQDVLAARFGVCRRSVVRYREQYRAELALKQSIEGSHHEHHQEDTLHRVG